MTEEKTEKKEAKLVEVTTQTQPAIQLEDDKLVSQIELAVIDHNILKRLEKALL